MVRSPYVGACSTERVDGRLFGWWAERVVGSVGFVGREGELSGLLSAVGGEVRLLLVTGDAGVGKTRFVTEGMRRAAADGAGGGVGRMPADARDAAVAAARGCARGAEPGGSAGPCWRPRWPWLRATSGSRWQRLLPQLGSGATEPAGPGKRAA